MDINTLSNSELIYAYSEITKMLKAKGIIHSKNVIGDLGEYIAIDYYCNTSGLPRLSPAPPSTKNIDAISINGERYSIKTTTTNTTGVFYGLNPNGSSDINKQMFEFVIIVKLDNNYGLDRINELTWDQFIYYKKWHSRMTAWNIVITNELLRSTRTIYIKNT